MRPAVLLAVLLSSAAVLGRPSPDLDPAGWLKTVESELTELSAEGTLASWLDAAGQYQPAAWSRLNTTLATWRLAVCTEAIRLPTDRVNHFLRRALHLLCRGPMYTSQLERESSELGLALQEAYTTSRLCEDEDRCYSIEPELTRLMSSCREPGRLLWAWEGWRDLVAPRGLALYPAFIHLQNAAANLNGYKDMGEWWRQEPEIRGLQDEAERLLSEIKPFHRLLYAFVRHRLARYYGPAHLSPGGLIPAHLLGNMWSQSWHGLLDMMMDTPLDLNTAIQRRFQNVTEMVVQAEEFYTSLGFKPMTEKFWKNSIFTKNANQKVSCHGTAANLFRDGDYRIILCGSVNWQDFYVIHHEMGHIEYYMSYEGLSPLFKSAANSGFQEAIGDTIMLAVESPSNLKRLGIIGDNDDIEIPTLLYQALKKIPHIVFGYVLDKWRWEVMANNISVENYNKVWWDYRKVFEGIQPPRERPKHSFDAFSKYHVPENMPYIRYFLSEFIQFQLYEVLCQMKSETFKIKQRFNLCDLYGFEKVGEKLGLIMSRGSMYRWDTLLNEFSGGKYQKMSAQPMLRYFQPLINWLQRTIEKEGIQVGW